MLVICFHTVNCPEVIAVARDIDEAHDKIQDYLGYHIDLQLGMPLRNPITGKTEQSVAATKADVPFRAKDMTHFTLVEVE